MELALSLGDTPKPFAFLEKSEKIVTNKDVVTAGFCMALGITEAAGNRETTDEERRGLSDPAPSQLDLLPFSPVPRRTTTHTSSSSPHLSFSWLTENLVGEPGSSSGGGGKRVVEVNNNRLSIGEDGSGTALSSPNSTTSSFQMEFSIYGGAHNGGRSSNKRDLLEVNNNELGGGSNNSRACSDEEENGSARKKLRLTKQQSAFLEESFKEHNTLNPKQKLALAKQLNLRPRQVEVWFQNRRARTKLKQTEVDCEYLKRCCETLTEENRRLQKELQELRALKSSQPFYMQLPPTTLTMCPSCERVASSTAANANATATAAATTNTALSLSKPKPQPQPQHQVAAS